MKTTALTYESLNYNVLRNQLAMLVSARGNCNVRSLKNKIYTVNPKNCDNVASDIMFDNRAVKGIF